MRINGETGDHVGDDSSDIDEDNHDPETRLVWTACMLISCEEYICESNISFVIMMVMKAVTTLILMTRLVWTACMLIRL